ncbi:MAG: DNA polymerase III subunit delta [Candidatus Accumulibacter regalis]|jgi:DNA polymerase-3 subunit delta|uniref:DNA polymerase III subunit delta n=1 Tax=Accumulibacter regalis TaxID=522306 RepID=A0A011R4I1_ACCRE|nr:MULTISPECIES: DNA polymerase III subunit delta [unclassified Candidatus Accumulibacter]EXI86039.1 MAG: DNA polymerase III subunit delta [Candidatus Accumulibacter regalis]HRE71268.1 DNA polymerase III subunit delta [Accumulibacter sp.]HRE85114.1 DNA polymerase III subunit delta [Accumulibacter sp.]
MQLKGEHLTAHLQRELKPVYLVHGDEPLLVIEAADAIRAAARRSGFDEREVLVAGTGFNWNDLYHAAGSMSLFAGRKLIDLRLPTGKPGRDGGAALQAYCARPSPDALLLVTMTGADWREEKAAWVGAVAAAGAVVKLIAPGLAELPAWIAGRLAGQQQSADAAGLRFIAERVEGNLLAAHQEILKLEVLYPSGALSGEQIRDAVLNVARYDLDGLREAMLAGDVVRLTRTIDGLQQEGEAPPLVLWAMTEEVRALAQINAGLEARQPLTELLKEARVWGSRQVQIRQALQRVNGGRARAALAHAARIDRMIKGLASGDVWNEFLRLGLNIAVA